MRRAWLCLVLVGCHDLPDLGVCGNGVVESSNGEACDGDEGGDLCSDTCLLTCQASAVAGYVEAGVDTTRIDPATLQPAPVFCPEGMRCGLDSVCRAPSGQFGLASTPQPFEVRNVPAIGDVDGDRVDDLAGSSATGLIVRFGSQAGTPFGDGFVQDAPSSESPVAFFDRDPSRPAIDRPDMAIAVPTDGLSFLTSNIESFAPDLDVFVDLTGGQRFFTATDPGKLGAVDIGDVVMSIPVQGQLVPRRIAVPPVFPQELLLGPCGPAGAQLIDVVVPRFDRRSLVVVVKTAVSWATCVYRQDTGAGVWLPPVVTVFATPPPTTVALADLEDDNCHELVFARTVPPMPSVLGFARASQATSCNFTTTLVQFTNSFEEPQAIFDAGSIIPEGAGPSRDELVMTSGVYRANGTTLELVAAPTSNVRPWTSAALVDLNSDSILDVVAARAGQDDVDVVRGGAQPNVYRADTTFPVKQVVAGDFDGDRLGDAALVERAVAGGDRLAILYGSADGFVGPAIGNSAVGGDLTVARIGRFNWGATVRGNDGIDDLVVARVEMQGGNTIARGGVMLGDAPRILVMPRFPPMPVDTIGAIAAGTFATPSGDRVLVAALRSPDVGMSDLLVHDVAANSWMGPVRIGTFEVDPTSATQILRGTVPMIAAKGAVDPMMMTAQTPMAVVGLDGKACSFVADGRINLFHGVDVDGDGADELVYATEQVNNATVRQVHVRTVVPNQTGSCSGEEILVDALAGCDDVARISGTLVALCESQRRYGVYRIDAGVREERPFAEVEGIGLQLVVGDFDGDGVPDLGVGMARAEVGAQFIKQCAAHDVRNCR
jgi:hypothetical protein